MTEATRSLPEPIATATVTSLSAGGLLRAAREKRGLHIAALAASIKVSPRKLEALEADRHAELPDLTFTRALALTVCRALKVDPEPVLAKLPHAGDLPKLSRVGGGLNAPFRGAPGSRDPGEFNLHRKPAFWATLLILLGAVALALVPDRWVPWHGPSTAMMGAAATASAVMGDAAAASTPNSAAVPPSLAASGPPLAGAAASAATFAGAVTSPTGGMGESAPTSPPQEVGTVNAAGVLSLRTTGESWIDVQDARGQTLLSRAVQRGEAIALDGALPMRVTIGNSAATQLVFRGQPVDLTANTRDNVARLQLP